jgi:hypothetical protein
MPRKWSGVLVAGLVVAGSFTAGYVTPSFQGYHPPVVTAERCDTGASGGSCFVGSTAYGIEDSPLWLDGAGALHDDSWPACLPRMGSVQDVRIAADWVWIGSSAYARVLMVDCQGH